MKVIKGYSSRIINKNSGSSCLWPNNPVRKEIVLSPAGYPYSSAYFKNPTDIYLYLGINDSIGGTRKSPYPEVML
jgi:hypothetical protein